MAIPMRLITALVALVAVMVGLTAAAWWLVGHEFVTHPDCLTGYRVEDC